MKTNVAYSIRKMFIILFAFGLLLVSGANKDVFAVTFYNGNPTIIEDIVEPNLDIAGGWNITNQPVPNTGPTSLMITTKKIPLNFIQLVVGGSIIDNRNNNTMHGDIRLAIQNTIVSSNNVALVGGNLVVNGTSHMHGNINLFLSNSIVPDGDIILGTVCNNGNAYLYGSLNAFIVDTYVSGSIRDISGGVNCTGNINVGIKNSSADTITFAGGTLFNSTIAGNMNITVQDSLFTTLTLARSSSVLGNINFHADKTQISENMYIVNAADVMGNISVLCTNSFIRNINVGPTNFNVVHIKRVDVTLSDTIVNNFNASPNNNHRHIINNFNLHFLSGFIHSLNISDNFGTIENANINIYGGNINTITIGGNRNAWVDNIYINIYGGSINNINCNIDTNSTINFLPGKTSYVQGNIEGRSSIEEIFIHKHAFTKWGLPNNTATVETQKFYFAGNLIIPHNSSVELNVTKSLVADGGAIFPENHLPYLDNVLFTLIGQPNITVVKPIEVNLSLSPMLIGQQNILFAELENNNSELFADHNYSGLLWSDSHYDPATNKYYLNNIRASEDYYAYSSAREASSWLRGMHISSVQGRLRTTFTQKEAGFWVDLQGGKEKLDSAVGNSKMPWLMANIGYDKLSDFSSLKTIYGFSLGANKGNHRWESVHSAKNDIFMGVINGYAGVSHHSGIYSGVTAQVSIAKIKTKNPGLKSNKNWTEYIPSGAVELGWNYTLANGIKINPRAQLSAEQLSSHDFKLSHESGYDIATLKKSFIVSSMLGLAGAYETQVANIPFGIDASVDWIKGIAGDFASRSKVLNMTFKDKNDTDTIRTSLGVYTQVNESMLVKLNGFVDVGDDKGFGGQISATYAF